MRYFIAFCSCILSLSLSAQNYTKISGYGYEYNRGVFDSTLFIPTGCGVPSGVASLRGTIKTKMASLYWDSCNARFYAFDPKDSVWKQPGAGITSLNGLTGSTQTFTSANSGTDFNIVSSGTSHSFNFPDAGSTKRGLLTPADWSSFNSKQSAITLTTIGSSGAATFTSSTLNIPNYTLSGLGGIGLSSLSASSPITYNSGTGAISTTVANSRLLGRYSAGTGVAQEIKLGSYLSLSTDTLKVSGLGTASTYNVGTSANNVVQLDGSAKLPAVDGSQLTNLPASDFLTSVLAKYTGGCDFVSTYNYGAYCEFQKNSSVGDVQPMSSLRSGWVGGVTFSTSTSASGRSSLILSYATQQFYAAGAMEYITKINIGTLASVAQDYSLWVGWGDKISTEQNNGMYFKYIRSESTNWQAVAAAAGTRTTSTGGSPVAVAAGSDIVLKVTLNAAANLASFYINGALLTTINSNLPTSSSNKFEPFIALMKTAGTTNVNVDCDYIFYTNTLAH